jgi:hypothetical protein
VAAVDGAQAAHDLVVSCQLEAGPCGLARGLALALCCVGCGVAGREGKVGVGVGSRVEWRGAGAGMVVQDVGVRLQVAVQLVRLSWLRCKVMRACRVEGSRCRMMSMDWALCDAATSSPREAQLTLCCL